MDQNGSIFAQAGKRSGALDAMRFFAALFVVFYDYAAKSPLWAPVDPQRISPILADGWVATDLFVMLSGFVLGRAWGRALDEGRVAPLGFLVRRLKRIWPAHILVLIGLVALAAVCAIAGVSPHRPERFDLADLAPQAALLHGTGLVDHLSWNAPSWTLSALVVCYALFPALWRAMQPVAAKAAALFLALDVLALAALLSHFALHEGPWRLPLTFCLLRVLPLFAAGSLLARFAEGLQFRRHEATGVAAGAAVGLGLFLCARPSEVAELGAVTAICFLILGLNASSLVRGGWAERLGRLSFALFITHVLSGAIWFGLVRDAATEAQPAAAWLLWLLGFPVAVGFAWLFDRFVDQPIQRALAPLFSRASRGAGAEQGAA